MKILKDLDKLHSTHAEYKSWIEKLNNLNEKYEEYLQEKRDNWNDKLNPLFGKLKSQPKELIELQSLCLSYRQQLTEEIAFFMNKLSKEIIDYKNAKSDRFMFYATGFGLKTNLSEKNILIESELAQLQRNKELFESHIEFLRECKVACDNVNWAIKNRLEIYKIIDQ